MAEKPLENFWYSQEEKMAIWKELELNEDIVRQSVANILDWTRKQPHLSDTLIDEACLEKLLIISKGSVERTKHLVDNFYKYRTWAPELIQNRQEILDAPMNTLYKDCILPNLPKLYEGKRLWFLKLAPNIESIDIEGFFKTCFMIIDLRLKHDYWSSEIWILDLKNLKMSLFYTIKLNALKKAATTFEKSYKWRLHGIHLVNSPVSPAALQVIVDVFKAFVSSRILGRLIIHDSLDSLYKHVPKEYLPEDLGGTAPSIDALTESLEKEVKKPENKEVMLKFSNMVCDVSKMPKVDTMEELDGCFKQLEFD